MTSLNDKLRLKNAVIEISNSLVRIKSERDLIKEIINTVVEELDLPKEQKSQLRRLAKVYNKQNYSEVVTKDEEFQDMYVELLVSKSE